MLLESSKDGNKATNDGLTPLLVAVSMGHADVTRALVVSPKVDINKASNEGETPLYLARCAHRWVSHLGTCMFFTRAFVAAPS